VAVKRKIRKASSKLQKEIGVGLLNPADLSFLGTANRKLQSGFASLPPVGTKVPGSTRVEKVLLQAAGRLQNNYPYFHPLYAGQMLKPPHPIAQLAYTLAMSINPNNHALEGGRATSALEKEAVAEIAAMFGWRKFLGHLCGGGTIANLEALWIAGQLQPGKTILASTQAHYTHARLTKVLQLPFESIECDSNGRINVSALEKRLAQGGIAAVVATMGTTATGSVDPLHEMIKLRGKHKFRIHADAAYGGYFPLVNNLRRETQNALAAIGEADSIAIDPHKHGLQPYGCGCILFKDPSVGRYYKHNSPYTYFTSSELHLGEISLECSRPGAVAAALWATQQLLPLKKGREFAEGLAKSRQAALAISARLQNDPRFIMPFPPDLDVVIFALNAATVSAASKLSRQLFKAAAKRDLHLALVELPLDFFPDAAAKMRRDRETITCIRSALMKPEHLAWADEIWQRLQSAASEALT
jgi:tyrosine decarboxylase/aspartate 1-decarboxylase